MIRVMITILFACVTGNGYINLLISCLHDCGILRKCKFTIIVSYPKFVLNQSDNRVTKVKRASSVPDGEGGSGDEVPIEVDFTATKRSSSFLRIEKLNSIDDCTITSRPGDKLSVFYIGKFENGEIFDFKTKKRRNDKGFTFTLGARQVIQGWDIVSRFIQQF